MFVIQFSSSNDLRDLMHAHSLFCLMVPPFEKVTHKKISLVLLYVNILFLFRHFATLKWLKILKLSKIYLKMVKAMMPKTTDQNVLFLNERIPYICTVDLTSVVSNYLSLLITTSD